MTDQSNVDSDSAASGWEDDGGARGSDVGRRTGSALTTGDRHRSQQECLDASHQSDLRGENRYDNVHQTGAEQKARKDRDDLKRALGGKITRRAG